MGRIPQDNAYHQFADTISAFDIPNFHNVVSNFPFLILSLLGLIMLNRGHTKIDGLDRAIIWTLFLGIGLIGFGSAYYHLAPENDSLVWDRLPMTLVFASFFTLIIKDYLSEKLARYAFYPLIAFGLGSIFYWHYTELTGQGDLRLYAFMQFYPMICIIAILIFSKNRDNLNILGWVMASYGLAKLCEHFDNDIFELINYGGHALKHYFSALGVYFMYIYVTKRQLNKLSDTSINRF
jgi:hypothetical protein